MSVKKIADTLVSNGRKISVHTVETYLESLTESYIFNKVSRYDIKGKQYLETGEKYYATDFTIPLSPFVYLTPLIVKSLDASIPK